MRRRAKITMWAARSIYLRGHGRKPQWDLWRWCYRSRVECLDLDRWWGWGGGRNYLSGRWLGLAGSWYPIWYSRRLSLRDSPHEGYTGLMCSCSVPDPVSQLGKRILILRSNWLVWQHNLAQKVRANATKLLLRSHLLDLNSGLFTDMPFRRLAM